MKIDIEIKKIITEKYKELKSTKDLADLLIYIKKHLLYKNKKEVVPISLKSINYYAFHKKEKYTTFYIQKKSGKKREINSPDTPLLSIQKSLNILFQILFEKKQNYASNGFLANRNIMRNAEPHTGKNYVLNIDLENFFPSINFRRVKTVLSLDPFGLKNDKDSIGFLIANICCYNGVLPQGAATSPILSNIVCQKLDRKLLTLSNKLNFTYTRYADDLTFSSNNNIFNEDFIKKIEDVVLSENLKINYSKVRIKNKHQRQTVTGLIVNRKVNVSRQYIRTLRAILNNWNHLGIQEAIRIFTEHNNSKELLDPDKFTRIIEGRVNFAGLVRGKNDPIYKSLHHNLRLSKNCIDYNFIHHNDVKQKLIEDNIKMERTIIDSIHNGENRFISFCTIAFHQIENLLRYYYWEKFNLKELKEYLLKYNPKFNQKNAAKIKGMKDVHIYFLIYIFESEFYFNKGEYEGKYYDSPIKKLRDIRNDESHRCQVEIINKQDIINKYNHLLENQNLYIKTYNISPTKTEEEIKLEYDHGLITYIENKNYKLVRKVLNDIIGKIKLGLCN